MILYSILVLTTSTLAFGDPSSEIPFNTAHSNPSPVFEFNDYGGAGAALSDDVYTKPVVEFMAPAARQEQKSPHVKGDPGMDSVTQADPWGPFDFSKFDSYLGGPFQQGDERDHNRLKRKAKRRGRGRSSKRRNKARGTTVQLPAESDGSHKNVSDAPAVPIARRADPAPKPGRRTKYKDRSRFETYQPQTKEYESDFVEMPKDLYQAHLRPGVIFRIHMAEAILKMQYRGYAENKDESVIEADVEYLRLTRKVIMDEITKFEDLKWLIGWFNNRSELIQEHMCNVRYFAVGIPPTMFTTPEEYMKRMCLFDSVYIDHIPYVVGEDNSLMAAVAPPVLHCDAATCTSVPFIDSLMFEERLPRTNVRTVTRCQASCRAHCRNDPDCLKRCSERCLRAEKK